MINSTEKNPIMKPKEVSKYLGLHLVTIYRLLKQKEIPAVKIGGQWRFHKKKIDEWLDNRITKRG